jgi:MFS family permease
LILGKSGRTQSDFALLFCAAAAGIGFAALLLACSRSAQLRTPRAPLGIGEFIRTVREYWPGTVAVVGLTFHMCITVPFGFLTSYIDQAGLNAARYSVVGLFFLVYGGWGLLVRLLVSPLPDRIGRRKVLLAGMVLMAAGLYSFLAVDASRPWLIVLPAMLCGSGHAMCFPTVNALLLERFPNHVRGSGSTLSLIIADLGIVAGAPMLGLVADVAGYDAMFVLSGACAFASAIYFAWKTVPIWRERRKQATDGAMLHAEMERTSLKSLPSSPREVSCSGACGNSHPTGPVPVEARFEN